MSLGEIKIIDEYDSLDLFKKASALKFIGSNQHYSSTLYYLCLEILNSKNGREIASTAELKEIVEKVDAKYGYLNDPFEEAFTCEILFFGGPQIIFPGYLKNSKTIIEGLLNSVFKYPKIDHEEFKSIAYIYSNIIFSISNELCERFSLEGNTKVEGYESLIIPDDIHTIKKFVSFSKKELIEILGNEFHFKILNDLLSIDFANYELSEDPSKDQLTIKPFLIYNQEFIINDPCNLTNTLRYLILKKADEYNLTEEVLDGYHKYLSNLINTSFKSLGWTKVHYELPEKDADVKFNEFIYGFDIDKCGYVITLEDHLINHDFSNYFGTWVANEQIQILYNRIKTIADTFDDGQVVDVFVVIVINSLARTMMLGFEDINHDKIKTYLAIHNGDLELFSYLEAGNDLQLYKYSMLFDHLSKNTVLPNTQFLDVYNLYKNYDHSFYIGDDNRPDSLFISYGEGRYLINEYIDKFDRHVSIYHDRKSYCEVIKAEKESSIPIYWPLSIITNHDKRAHLVEGYLIPIWVLESEKLHNSEVSGSLIAKFIDMVSFWLWQLTNELDGYLKNLRDLECLVIELDFENYSEWNEQTIEQKKIDSSIVTISIDKDIISLSFTSSFKSLSVKPENHAERLFLKCLINGVSKLLESRGDIKSAKKLHQEADKIIAKVAPVGPKKKILLLNNIRNISLNNKGLPPLRYVKNHNENILLDSVGKYITDELGYKVGSYSGEDAVKIINKVVSYLYSSLEGLLKNVSVNLALQTFISQNEKLIQSADKERLIIPGQLACYSDESKLRANLTEESDKRNKTSVANRFIIEYLASIQPTGEKPISKLLFDEILATASEIIGWAFMSDMIHFELAETEISILKSGRIGTPKSTFNKARESFSQVQSKKYIKSAIEHYESFWPTSYEVEEKSDHVKNLDKVFEDEFKVTLTGLMKIYGDIIDLGVHKSNLPTKIFNRKEVLEFLLEEKDNKEHEVLTSIELITLNKRDSFLAPPKPYKKEDVYPWRYMRPLSYLRKPIISLNNDKKELLIWGTRGLIKSASYLRSIILTGRLQAKVNSPLLESYMGKIHQQVGEEFNSYVANQIKSLSSGLIVVEQLKKVGKERLQKNGKDLGDIDILVISRRKKNIFVLECKDLAIARNPYEMANEIDTLIRGSGKSASTVEKHLKRTNWIKENIDSLKEYFDLKPRGNWEVFSYIVVDEEMFTPHLTEAEIEIMSFDSFITDLMKMI